jgi:type I restriction enzyme S subunit
MKKLNKAIWSNADIEQIVDEVSDRVENPSQSEYQKFVGLEDFESGQFKIKKWGSTENLVSAMKLFKKGDLLFARRNAYLKRASEVDFDGVCSGDAIVLREKSKIEKGLLTFILNTDRFWEYAIANAAGTMSKRVKWRDLAKYKFLLPPLSEQKQIAALFQSIETAMEQVDGQEKNLKALQKSLLNGLLSKEPEFGNLLNSKNCKPTTFGEIAECDKKYPEHQKEVERFVGLEYIEADNFKLQGWGEIANGTTFSKRFVKGDVLFGKRRAYLKKVAVADFDGICSGDILVIRAKAKKLLQGLLPYYISADAFIQHAVSTSAGSLSPRTKWKDLADLEVSIPDPSTQSTILEVLQQLDKTVNQLKQQKTTLKNLKQKLLNEILG